MFFRSSTEKASAYWALIATPGWILPANLMRISNSTYPKGIREVAVLAGRITQPPASSPYKSREAAAWLVLSMGAAYFKSKVLSTELLIFTLSH